MPGQHRCLFIGEALLAAIGAGTPAQQLNTDVTVSGFGFNNLKGGHAAMSGKIKRMIDRIVDERSKGSEVLRSTTLTKIILKGVNVKKYTDASPDDPETIDKLRQIARELGVTIPSDRARR